MIWRVNCKENWKDSHKGRSNGWLPGGREQAGEAEIGKCHIAGLQALGVTRVCFAIYLLTVHILSVNLIHFLNLKDGHTTKRHCFLPSVGAENAGECIQSSCQ